MLFRNWAFAAAVGLFLVGGYIYYSRGHTVETGKTVIRVWDWWSPASSTELGLYFERIEADFEARHPDIDLRYQFIPYGTQYIQKLMAAFAAGEPPDAFQCSVAWALDIYERGVVRDLNDFLETSPEVALEEYFPVTAEYLSKDGRVFGVPTSMDSSCLIFNADMVRAAGLDASPHAIDSWETFTKYAKALTVRDERGRIVRAGFPLAGMSERFTAYLPWLAADGKEFYTADKRSTNATTLEGISTMRFLKDLLHTHGVSFPPGAEIQVDNLFFEGKAAFLQGGTWMGYELRQRAPKMDFVMTAFPPGPHGTEAATITWVNMMMMPKSSKHPEETWEYLRYYGGLENAVNMLEILNRNSARLDFYETPQWKAKVDEYPYLTMLPEISAAGRMMPHKRYQETNEAFVPYYQHALLGTMEVEDAMREGNARVEGVLEGTWADQLLLEMKSREELPR